MSDNRSWMYNRVQKGMIVEEFVEGVDSFLDFAFAHPERVGGDKIRCPSNDCQCMKWKNRRDVKACLLRHGFQRNYTRWTQHGEPYIPPQTIQNVDIFEDDTSNDDGEMDNMRDMLMDAIHPEYEAPVWHEDASDFYKLLKDAEEPLWQGCKKHTKLSAVTRLLQLKSDHRWSNRSFNAILKLIKEMLPEDANLSGTYYEVNGMMKRIGLQYEEIHACVNDCVLFWGDNHLLMTCPSCNHPRYKNQDDLEGKKNKKLIAWKILRYFPIASRLQRLYMSSKIAEHMKWHGESRVDVPGEMRHPADGEAWKDFDQNFPDFAKEVRNVRLGLASDGFEPFGTPGIPHSIWPVFLFPYNVPPWMCMKQSNLFMTMLIPGPKSPGKDIDVYMQPLIKELNK